ncbi:hypothetical protein MMC20_002463 [Loxospora ochrophaea]|nr:hypothetical protein [Loxospora ochrophaea]
MSVSDVPNATNSSSSCPETPTSSVNVTSTNGNGSHQSCSPESDSNAKMRVGLGVGLGIGVPLLMALGSLGFLLMKEKRRNEDLTKQVNQSGSLMRNQDGETWTGGHTGPHGYEKAGIAVSGLSWQRLKR